jgi:hypothetical protein
MPFVATFSGVAVSAAQDLFEIVAPSTKRVHVYEIVVGQYSDAGDAAAELLGVTVMRGHTTAGTGGTTATPVSTSGSSGAPSASATVLVNNTTVATGGSPATVRAETWNIQGPYCYNSDNHYLLEASQRLVVRITAPSDGLTMSGTLVFDEVSI